MTEDELKEKGIYIKPYGHGVILEDHTGKRHDRVGKTREVVCCGIDEVWVYQPISIGEPFPTREAALEFAEGL